MSLNVVIADDHAIVREGLKAVFLPTGIKVVGEAADGIEAFKLIKKLRPTLALLDVRMPAGDGITCLARVKLEIPATAVLMFSGQGNLTYMARSVALGASGYLLKSASPEQIVHAIQAAASGEMIWSRDELRKVTGALLPAKAGADVSVALTKRESEVLKQIALGLTNKEIGQSLGISYETVKEHVQHVLQKLGVSDRTQAAVWAVRQNLV
jgi:DNA-binding NarL/FixJ family response regulator